MQARDILTFAACAALVACGSAPDGGGSSPSATGLTGEAAAKKVAAARADLPRPDPGLYRTTVEMVDVDLPGAPEGVAEMMRNSMKQDRASDYCVTAADVEKGYEEMVRRSQQGDCTFQRFDVVGGKIDAEMTCRGDRGGMSTIAMSGTAGRTSSDMDVRMKMELPGMGEGTMRMKSRSERIGACP